MHDSLFAALRIVALMISADGKLHPKEMKWFLGLVDLHGVTREQRQILKEDLKGEGDAALIFADIQIPIDREQLMKWLKSAMSLNEAVHPKEQKLFTQITELYERRSSSEAATQYTYAVSVLEADRQRMIWPELAEAAKYFKQRARMFGWYGPFPNLSNKFIIWFLIIFVLISATARGCARAGFFAR